MSFETKTADLPWIGGGASWILASVEVSRDREPGSGACIADEVEDFGVTVERFGSPVFGDLGKQAVLDGIPFGSAGGVVSDCYCESKKLLQSWAWSSVFQAPVRQLLLPPVSARMSNFPAAAVAISAVALPPVGDGVRGEGGGVMRDAYEDRATVGEQVVDAVWDRDADGIGTEIVIMDEHRRASHFTPLFLKFADQFSLFGIDADDGKPLALKAGTQ